jgi:hypothetical protein
MAVETFYYVSALHGISTNREHNPVFCFLENIQIVGVLIFAFVGVFHISRYQVIYTVGFAVIY